MLLSLAISLASCSAVSPGLRGAFGDGPILTAAGMVGRGYDIMHGNPLAMVEDSVTGKLSRDPGWRQPIFDVPANCTFASQFEDPSGCPGGDDILSDPPRHYYNEQGKRPRL